MKNIFKNRFKKEQDPLSAEERMKIIEDSSKLVGPGVFYSTLIVIASFLPVFLLTGMEGKLFSPLAWTKSFILIVDAFLAITLTPVLISFLLKGKLRSEEKNPINRKLEKVYTPILVFCLKWRKTILAINVVALLIGGFMFTRLGSEFMPPLDEGSILFMPVTLPDVSNAEIKRILQVQDKLIRSIPEVTHVLGKAGRANSRDQPRQRVAGDQVRARNRNAFHRQAGDAPCCDARPAPGGAGLVAAWGAVYARERS